MRWDILQRIGGFHPVLLPHYWSDYEFTIRAHQKGIALKTSANVYLTAFEKETGLHTIQVSPKTSIFNVLKQIFSKRSIPNPIYRTSFILLTFSSWFDMLDNIIKIWGSSVISILKACKKKLKSTFEHYQLKRSLHKKQGDVRIVIGAASTEQQGWIATNYPVVDVTDYSVMKSFFPNNSVSAILAEHVWEHLGPDQALLAVENCFNCLEPGGYLRLAVPDGNHSDEHYIKQVRPGGTGAGSDDHKLLYTHNSMVSLLEKAGFQVRLLEWFDENQVFHAEDWSEDDGLIMRSTRFDKRNETNPTAYTSLIVDAVKPR
jgi:predicted SAM-dependent methyltransferase